MREVMGFLGGAVAGQRLTNFGDQRLRLEVTDITQRELGSTSSGREKPSGTARGNTRKISHTSTRERGPTPTLTGTLRRSLVEFVLQTDEGRVLDFDLPPVDVGSGHFLVHHLTQVAECDVGVYTVVVPPVDFEGKRENVTSS